jgi:hypothetical protein
VSNTCFHSVSPGSRYLEIHSVLKLSTWLFQSGVFRPPLARGPIAVSLATHPLIRLYPDLFRVKEVCRRGRKSSVRVRFRAAQVVPMGLVALHRLPRVGSVQKTRSHLPNFRKLVDRVRPARPAADGSHRRVAARPLLRRIRGCPRHPQVPHRWDIVSCAQPARLSASSRPGSEHHPPQESTAHPRHAHGHPP